MHSLARSVTPTPTHNFCLRTDHAGDDINGGAATSASALSTAICFSPTTAIFSPQPRPCFLPSRGHLFSPPRGCRWGSGQGLHPLAGRGLSEPVAVLALGDQDMGMME